MTAEEIAAMIEIAEDVGDVPLVLATMLALCDDAFQRDLRAMLNAAPPARRAARALLGEVSLAAANG